jgi:hypothetical protein
VSIKNFIYQIKPLPEIDVAHEQFLSQTRRVSDSIDGILKTIQRCPPWFSFKRGNCLSYFHAYEAYFFCQEHANKNIDNVFDRLYDDREVAAIMKIQESPLLPNVLAAINSRESDVEKFEKGVDKFSKILTRCSG